MFVEWRGEYAGRECRLRWEDGNVSGDAVLMAALIAEAAAGEGLYVFHNPKGPYTTHDHLANPYSAMVILRDLAPLMQNVADDLPPRADARLDTLFGRHPDSWGEYVRRSINVQ